jgi:hypothetical protein
MHEHAEVRAKAILGKRRGGLATAEARAYLQSKVSMAKYCRASMRQRTKRGGQFARPG